MYALPFSMHVVQCTLIRVHHFLQDDDHQQQATHTRPQRLKEEWMLICQMAADLQPDISTHEEFDWTAAAQSYSNLDDTPSFISRNRQQVGPHTFNTSVNPANLQGRQLEVYTAVKDHFESANPTALRMIVTGTAGTGKSYLIHCIRLLLGDALDVGAPTGVASYIIEGTTLHTLLHLPTRGEFKQLEGARLQQLQDTFSTTKYIITDEMSMVGRKMLGQIDRRLRQAFSHHAQEVFG